MPSAFDKRNTTHEGQISLQLKITFMFYFFKSLDNNCPSWVLFFGYKDAEVVSLLESGLHQSSTLQ